MCGGLHVVICLIYVLYLDVIKNVFIFCSFRFNFPFYANLGNNFKDYLNLLRFIRNQHFKV